MEKLINIVYVSSLGLILFTGFVVEYCFDLGLIINSVVPTSSSLELPTFQSIIAILNLLKLLLMLQTALSVSLKLTLLFLLML